MKVTPKPIIEDCNEKQRLCNLLYESRQESLAANKMIDILKERIVVNKIEYSEQMREVALLAAMLNSLFETIEFFDGYPTELFWKKFLNVKSKLIQIEEILEKGDWE